MQFCIISHPKIHFSIITRKYKFVFINAIFVKKHKFCINNTVVLLLGYPNTLWPRNP